MSKTDGWIYQILGNFARFIYNCGTIVETTRTEPCANKMCEKKIAFKTQVSIWIIELRPIEAIALLINAAISSLFQALSLQTWAAVHIVNDIKLDFFELKRNYFKNQCSSSSFLLTQSNNTGPNRPGELSRLV